MTVHFSIAYTEMTSNSTMEDTSLLEKGSQNETGEFMILLHIHTERIGSKQDRNRRKAERTLTLRSVINKVSSSFQTIKCINIESKICSANKSRSVCHLAAEFVHNMHHFICVLDANLDSWARKPFSSFSFVDIHIFMN